MSNLVDVYILDSSFVVVTDDPSYISDYLKLYETNCVQTLCYNLSIPFQKLLNEKEINSLDTLKDFLEKNKEIFTCEKEFIKELIYTSHDFPFGIEIPFDGYVFFWNTHKGIAKIVSVDDFNDLQTIFELSENFKLIKIYSESSINKESIIETNDFLCHKRFYSLQDLLDKLPSIEKLFGLGETKETLHLEENINRILEEYYSFTKDSKDRIRCSVIYSQIERLFPDTPPTEIKGRVLEVLKNLGIIRKRFSDGYHFIGIIHSTNSEVLLRQMERRRKIELEGLTA